MNALARGFTLVEVMVAMAIGLVVSAVLATMFASNSRTYRIAGTVGELQEAGRFAVESFQRDARMVGYRGCNSSNVLNTTPLRNQIANPADYVNDIGTPLAGFEASGGSWNPALPTEISAPGAPVPSALTAGSDVLLTRVVVGDTVQVSGLMPSVTADIPVAATAGFGGGDRMVIADCAAATAFAVTGAGGGVLQHGSGANSSGSVLRAYGPDASAMRTETHAYFVAPSVQDPVNERSLWLRIDAQPPVVLVENVQALQLLYGVDTDNDFVPNNYRTANNVPAANWANVTALHVSLLLRGGIGAQNDAPAPFVFNGVSNTPTDRRMRRVYNATIQLRNRVP